MADYLHLFHNNFEYENYAYGSGYTEPFVGATQINGENYSYRTNYNLSEYEKLRKMPLTFEITSDGVINWCAHDTEYTCTIEYSKNGGEWTSITSNTGSSAPTISVVSGDTVQFRGDNVTYSSGQSRYNQFSGTTCSFKAKGNVMSLIDSTDFAVITTLQSAYTFIGLFMYCSGLTDTSELMLPATTLTLGCYFNMFCGCTGLTTAPELPATTLTTDCYYGMFRDCTSLTTAPELPATTLANWCYSGMFEGCTGLTTAPELPATTLANSCYANMFVNCKSLTTAPELLATTLVDWCYSSMFNSCQKLNYIKCLATDISAPYCTINWVYDVQTNSGTFVKASGMNDWTTDINGIPTNWTVMDA